MDGSWQSPSVKGAGLHTDIICNFYNEKYQHTMGLCAVIKWPFLRHPLGNNAMSVNVKDDLSPSCFVISPFDVG